MSHPRFRSLAAVIVGASLTLAACGSSGSTGTASGGYGPTPSTATSPSTGATGGGSAGNGTSPNTHQIHLADDPTLGRYLVAPDGRTLYRFTQDHGTTSACQGTCLDAWPPFTEASPTAANGITGKLTSIEGAVSGQVAIDGHLLYEYAGDKAPGDVTGTSIPDWYAVAPDGSTIEH